MGTNNVITTELVNGIGKPSILIVNFHASTLSVPVLRLLDDILTNIEKYQHRYSSNKLDGVIFTSESKIFLAGADLFYLNEIKNSPPLIDTILDIGHDTFTRIQKLKIPTVAAIHGACLGGGFELVLACDYRICSKALSLLPLFITTLYTCTLVRLLETLDL